ncbi:hypothetical protein PQR71_35890 [Paraburkholderia fungorum]|jgi:hypothetical protein|uniref:hypothetical protein n=1 Tax=Paraburkholderia fungorum TaxID=134537 RepID=UPI0038BC78E8
MKLIVSTPVQSVLVATVVSSVVVLLRPESVELPLPVVARTSAATGRQIVAPKTAHQEDRPWNRPLLPEPVAPKAVVLQASGLPPLPPSRFKPDANPTPPLPPIPAALMQPDVVYLGRMIKDGKVQVFFASNGDPVVLSAGDVLNGSWRVQAISATEVTLHHLQTGETQQVATGGSADPHQSSVATVQIGQRFLASQPIQQQKTD